MGSWLSVERGYTGIATQPTFSPSGGTYTSAQSVTISTTTSGATIYYTTDGSTPTTGSTQYSSPVMISSTETLKAIAILPGNVPSTIGGASYVIQGGASFDFYIATTGSDSNPGTLSQPWAVTAINTKQAAYAGKRLGLLPGTYVVSGLMGTNESVAALTMVGGSSSSAQTYIGSSDAAGNYSRGTATLDAMGSTGFYGGSNANASAIMAARSGCNYWTVDGLRFTGFSMWAFHVGDSPGGGNAIVGWTIQFCEFTGGNCSFATQASPANGVNCGIIISYCSQNGTVTQNWFHDNVGNSRDTQHWSCVYQWSLASSDKSFNSQYTFNTIVKSGNLHGKEGGPPNDPNQFNTTIAYNYIDMTGTLATSEFCGSAIEGFMSTGVDAGAISTQWHHNVILANSMALSFDNDNTAHCFVNYPLNVYNNTIIFVGNSVSGWVNGGYASSTGGDSPGAPHLVSYYNNLYYNQGGIATPQYGYFLTNTDAFDICDYNIYGTFSGGQVKFNTVPAGANTDTSLTSYSTLSAWATAIGGLEAHSTTNSFATSPFTNAGTYSDQFHVQSGSPAYQTGRVGGLSSGAVTNVGAWDGTGRPGASWVS